jgi:hypothetical protein
MSIGDKIVDSAEQAAHKIAETTDRITEKIADKVHHDDAPAPTGAHRGQPAAEDDRPGLMDKLTDAGERIGAKIEEMTGRHDRSPDDAADEAGADARPAGAAPNLDPTGKV